MLRMSTQGHSLCEAHKELHKGHKARGGRRGQSHQQELPTPLSVPQSQHLLACKLEEGKAGQFDGGRQGQLVASACISCVVMPQPIKHKLLPD